MKTDIIAKRLGEWAGETNFASAAFRLFLAVFFASVLGFERASKRHSAGSGLSVYSITLTIISAELKKYKAHREIIEALSTLEYVRHIEEMN